MSDGTNLDQKNANQEQPNIDLAVMELANRCISEVDGTAMELGFDASRLVALSVHIASSILNRCLVLADGQENRHTLKDRIIEDLTEKVEAAITQIDRSERELNSGIIRPQ